MFTPKNLFTDSLKFILRLKFHSKMISPLCLTALLFAHFFAFASAASAIVSPAQLGYGLASRRSNKLMSDKNYFNNFRRGFSSNRPATKLSSHAFMDGQKYKRILNGKSTAIHAVQYNWPVISFLLVALWQVSPSICRTNVSNFQVCPPG